MRQDGFDNRKDLISGAVFFVDMIVTQRGFQANSRVITVSDSMIEELLSLKR